MDTSVSIKGSQQKAVLGPQKTRRKGGYVMLRRSVTLGVATLICALLLTSALPPLLADQTDRAVIDAPVTLLTAPIAGEVLSMAVRPGEGLGPRAPVATLVNARVDRTTLIALEEKVADTQKALVETRNQREQDKTYLEGVNREIAARDEITTQNYRSEVVELNAQVLSAAAAVRERTDYLTRMSELAAHGFLAPAGLRTAKRDVELAQLAQNSAQAALDKKVSELDGARKFLFMGTEGEDLAALVRKRDDMQFQMTRLDAQEEQLIGAGESAAKLLDTERTRLQAMETASIEAPAAGEVLNLDAGVGRHVTAGDTIARMVDCDQSFVVAIFSYRQAADLAVGARVTIDAGADGVSEGSVSEILPKTSDKADEGYAVPFPQTERRELYALIRPDAPLRRPAAANVQGSCDIGRWVTVSLSGGWVPSTSVIWRSVAQSVGSIVRRTGAGGRTDLGAAAVAADAKTE